MADFKMRDAEKADIPHIIDNIVASESAGLDFHFYTRAFGVSDDEFRSVMSEVLADETPGHELSYTAYLIGVLDGKVVASTGAWIECIEDTPSKLIKANLLARAFGIEKWKAAEPHLRKLSVIDFDRTPKALQHEYSYVVPGSQANGYMYQMLSFQWQRFKEKYPELEMAQCQCNVNNKGIRAIAAKHGGWEVVRELKSDEDEIAQLTPHTHRLVWEMKF